MNTVHPTAQLFEITFYDEKLTKHNVTYFEQAFMCAADGCRQLFLSVVPMKKGVVNAHWEQMHPGQNVRFPDKLKTVKPRKDMLGSAIEPARLRAALTASAQTAAKSRRTMQLSTSRVAETPSNQPRPVEKRFLPVGPKMNQA